METLRTASGTSDARWWGRAMLALGALGTVTQYALTHVAYIYPITAARYLVGLLLCAPLVAALLVAALLVAGLQAGWRWARARFTPVWRQTPRWPTIAIASSVLPVMLIALNVGGWRLAFAQTSDPEAFGQPESQRHVALIAYLHERHVTRFYTDYWTCYKVVFATDQGVACGVFHDEGVFRHGATRVQAMSDLVATTPHAPYIFDMPSPRQRMRADEFASAAARGDPRATGYIHARVGVHEVVTYAGGG